MKTILTYGTFDLFHIGHLNLLRRLRNIGDRLIVGCSTDEFNSIKRKKTVMPYEHRAEILRQIRYVDEVFPEKSWNQKRNDIIKYQVNIFGMGDDWSGKFDDLNDLCEIIYLPRTKDVSTTDIRKVVNALHKEQVGELRRVVEHLRSIVNLF